VLADEAELEDGGVIAGDDIPDLWPRLEGDRVKRHDEIRDHIPADHLVAALHGGPADVLREVTPEVATVPQRTQITLHDVPRTLTGHDVSNTASVD
jgi:hypothetical protein